MSSFIGNLFKSGSSADFDTLRQECKNKDNEIRSLKLRCSHNDQTQLVQSLKQQVEKLTKENQVFMNESNEWFERYNELAERCNEEKFSAEDSEKSYNADRNLLGGKRCKKSQSRSRSTGRCHKKVRKSSCKSGKSRRGSGRCHKSGK